MINTREVYWKVFCDFCIHSLSSRGKWDTTMYMIHISKEMILNGLYQQSKTARLRAVLDGANQKYFARNFL